VTVAELFFLLLGLSLGIAVGAALLDLLRAQPPRHEVRVTVTHNALPPRATAASPRPAPSAALLGPLGVATLGFSIAPARRAPVAVPVERDPRAGATDPVDVRPSAVVAGDGSAAARASVIGAVAVLERPNEPVSGPRLSASLADEPAPRSGAAGMGTGEGQVIGECAAERQLAEERCLIAVQARERAEAAAQELREAQRGYDEAATLAESLRHESDPRFVAERKEAARRAFRAATAEARARRDLEVAATTWLTEINRINHTRREAEERALKERQKADELLVVIERLTIAADAARITGEAATNACFEARQALAACEEAHLGVMPGMAAAAVPASVLTDEGAEPGSEDEPPGLRAEHQPAIYRLVQGDRATLARIVAAVATAPEEQRRLQLLLSELVDAVVAGAIEQAMLEFPAAHPFWGDFSRAQCRDVAVALASLGYRFDGLGGFAGGRVPSQRDLSLAVGYAGLDPRRIRRWPTEALAADLYREVGVAADEYLAANAADLSLGEMVALLGRRSEGLADLWNQWGRVRPLLLAAG
jgi:hypothetical protein